MFVRHWSDNLYTANSHCEMKCRKNITWDESSYQISDMTGGRVDLIKNKHPPAT